MFGYEPSFCHYKSLFSARTNFLRQHFVVYTTTLAVFMDNLPQIVKMCKTICNKLDFNANNKKLSQKVVV